MNAFNREIKQTLYHQQQVNYIQDLKSLFKELLTKHNQQRKVSNIYIDDVLYKIFTIQQPLYEKKVFGLLKRDKKALNYFRTHIYSYLLHGEDINDDEEYNLSQNRFQIDLLVTKNDLLMCKTTRDDLFKDKIGIKNFSYLIHQHFHSPYPIYPSDVYYQHIEQLTREYDIHKKRFEQVFKYNPTLYETLIYKDLAYHGGGSWTREGGVLLFDFEAALSSLHLLETNYFIEYRDVFSRNEFLKLLKEDAVDFSQYYVLSEQIDWSQIVNGQDFSLLEKIIISNIPQSCIAYSIHHNYNLFFKNIDWITSSIKELKYAQKVNVDILQIIEKATIKNKLDSELSEQDNRNKTQLRNKV